MATPTRDQKTADQTAREKAAREHAAERRKDYLRALNEEREGCERAGKTERVEAIDAEIKRVKSLNSRTAPSSSQA